ncbi:HEAT repeat domain-containing protein [Pseudomonas sp. C9-3]|uniref:HEAT repeat domain-containing protein n=1 Tax=Pseudomonas sp. C9-3 TaxID=3078264 RepID=UPI0028F12068|nr:HEAT repeat domain-containing protein [Pseudomonas sp. C9-3]
MTTQAIVIELIKIVDSDAPIEVRAAAVTGLGHEGSVQAFAKVTQVLGSDAPLELRVAAAEGLGFIGNEAASVKLVLMAADESLPLELRTAAAIAAGRAIRLSRSLDSVIES